MIHPTALVDPGANLGRGVTVGPYSMIEGNVTIGDRTKIGAHVTIDAHTQIGPDCMVHHHAALGGPPQSVRYAGEPTVAVIGKNCIIREFVTVHRGTTFGGGRTEIGDNNFLMAYTHIAHDCKTGKGVVFANAATLAGHITVGDYATVGGLAAVHQFVRIGPYAFVGGMSGVVKDIPPYMIVSGARARLHGLNKVGLKRHGFSPEALEALKKTYRIVFRLGLTLNEAIERVKASVDIVPEVQIFLEFLLSSTRGVTRGRGSQAD
ncbi:MAG: acyl-ACP--UDP-N-acetylglucosamine O-acyltransferase [Thermodesulfobacteriota bacterium]